MVEIGDLYQCVLGRQWIVINFIQIFATGELCVVKAPIGMVTIPESFVAIPEEFFEENYTKIEAIQ